MDSCTIAGTSRSVTELAAVLRTYADQHGGTLQQYDRAGHGPAARPRAGATAEDLGRMLVFAARLAPTPAVEILENDTPELWQAVPTGLDLTGDAHVPISEWVTSAELTAARELFEQYRRGPSGRGQRRAWASKFLHLHWPAFFPIVDSRIENAYRKRAAELAEALQLPADPAYPRNRTPVLAYWAAIRDDLTTPGVTDTLANAAKQAATGDATDPTRLLAHLTPVRLADIINWAP